MSKQVSSLTSTRGFAALMVVIFHFGTSLFPFDNFIIFNRGNLAVSYFFVLSGFVMYLTYAQREIEYKDYLKRRIARVAPLYLFALFLSVLLMFFPVRTALPEHFSSALLANIFFVQVYSPAYMFAFNVPGWSLCVEMVFYLLFPFCLWLARKNIKVFIISVCTFYIISQAVHLLLLNNWHNADAPFVANYNPFLHLNQFLAGMVGGYIYYRYGAARIRIPAIVWLLLIIALVSTRALLFISLHNGLLAPFFLVFIVVLAIKDPWVLRNKGLVYFGEISYGIYLLQQPVHYYVCEQLNPKFLHLQQQPLFYIYFLCLFITAAFSYELIEKPLRNRINAITLSANKR